MVVMSGFLQVFDDNIQVAVLYPQFIQPTLQFSLIQQL